MLAGASRMQFLLGNGGWQMHSHTWDQQLTVECLLQSLGSANKGRTETKVAQPPPPQGVEVFCVPLVPGFHGEMREREVVNADALAEACTQNKQLRGLVVAVTEGFRCFLQHRMASDYSILEIPLFMYRSCCAYTCLNSLLATIGPHSDPRFLHLKLPARIKNSDGALETLSIGKF